MPTAIPFDEQALCALNNHFLIKDIFSENRGAPIWNSLHQFQDWLWLFMARRGIIKRKQICRNFIPFLANKIL